MFEVGEILYLISQKNHKIIPARVEAVTTVKKISGTEVSHQLSIPGAEKKVVLEKLDVKSFKKIDDLRTYVMDLLRKKVDEDIEGVITLAQEFWSIDTGAIPPDETKELQHEDIPEMQNQSVQEIELENGIKARVHLPQELL